MSADILQEKLQFQVVLYCELCKLRVKFQYVNPERRYRFCIACGQSAQVEE